MNCSVFLVLVFDGRSEAPPSLGFGEVREDDWHLRREFTLRVCILASPGIRCDPAHGHFFRMPSISSWMVMLSPTDDLPDLSLPS
jgi:hypothetical protein